MLDWTGMRDFLAVAEAGSLSAASKRLSVSQPTVGRRIAQLEDRLGTPLFIRTPKGLDLTDTGELILDHTRRMEEEAHAVERLVTGQEASLTGNVRLSTIEAIGSEWLIQNLKPFRERYPDIQMEVHIDSQPVDLLRGEADIAIRLMNAGHADLITKKVATMGWGLYASKEYLAQHGTPKDFDELQNHKVVSPSLKIVEDVKSFIQIPDYHKAQTVFRSNNFLTLLNAVREGFGIGVHAPLNADRCDNLVRLFPEFTVLKMDLLMVMHPDLRRSARVRATWEFLSDLFRKNRALLAGEVKPVKTNEKA